MQIQSRTLILFVFLTTLTVLSAFTINGNSQSPEVRKSRSRRSGISDQRLAELETLIALSNMRGKYLTVPVAYGVIDPERIGKRKRSSFDFFSNLMTAPEKNTESNFVRKLLRRLKNSQAGEQTPHETN